MPGDASTSLSGNCGCSYFAARHGIPGLGYSTGRGASAGVTYSQDMGWGLTACPVTVPLSIDSRTPGSYLNVNGPSDLMLAFDQNTGKFYSKRRKLGLCADHATRLFIYFFHFVTIRGGPPQQYPRWYVDTGLVGTCTTIYLRQCIPLQKA